MKTKISTILFTLISISLFGANITVSNTNDAGANSLREAITTANGNGEDDVITITATGTITLASNLPIISTSMTITGLGSVSLTIDGGDNHTIFEITGSSTVVTLEEMTITKGKGKAVTIFGVTEYRYGGGMFNEDATVTLNNCIFSANNQAHFGGGLFNYSGTMLLNNCNFLNNIAIIDPALDDNTGVAGAFYNLSNVGETASIICNNCIIDGNQAQDMGGAIGVASFDDDANDSQLEMNNCTVQNNSTTDRDGGGFLLSFCTVNLNSCLIKNNTPLSRGGGIRAFGGAILTCINTIFEDNDADHAGGAIHSESDNVTLRNCTFKNNISFQCGGAICTSGALNIDQCTFDGNTVNKTVANESEGGAITFTSGANGISNITNSTFINNRAELYGGAIEQAGGTLNLTNCTFSGNSAGTSGGAVEMYSSATTNMTNCTVVNNTIDANSTDGAGLGQYNGRPFSMKNSIVYNNKINSGSGAEDNFFGTITSGGYNIVGESGGLTTTTGDEIDTDPNLATIADNGGAVQTFAPNGGSISIDHVTNGSGPCTDARLAARTGNSDAGAYETAGTFGDVSIAVFPASVAENSGTDLVYTYTRAGSTCGNLLVNFSVAGSATLNSDYSASNHSGFNSSAGSVLIPDGSSAGTLNVTPIDNAATDGSRTVVLTVTTGSGYNVAGSGFSTTGTITDDESPSLPAISVVAGSAQTENSNTAIQYTFTRTGDNSALLTVKFSIDDANSTASSGEYTVGVTGGATLNYPTTAFNGEITFLANSSTAILTVTPVGDSSIEADEIVVVKVAAP